MKAIVVSQYGGPEVLEYKDFPDPSPGPDEVLVRVVATSVNPIDLKRRSGAMKAFMPIQFPGVLGVDVAGTVISCGDQVKGLSAGDRVFGMADQTYAERCVVKAASLAKILPVLDTVDAAALPLVTTTGYQLISSGAPVHRGQTILVTGAFGGVGRSAVFAAKSLGATVIAGVRKKQVEQARHLGADSVVAIDSADEISSLKPLDAVADTVDGATAEALIARVKDGGIFASVLGPPQNSGKFPGIKVVPVYAQPDAELLIRVAKAVIDGSLEIPIVERMPLKDAAKAHALVERGASGKVLLVA
ncbi:MAG TPA: NADP-dependent oxidoreductase [Candidatus Acidoferrales bacterium]|jgi:NADPH:quinone reductase-like Zn-dependent oxidoreductase|nr:NADP-dependent oxidoreductase [Candidatus Acidoferrales bacterium]